MTAAAVGQCVHGHVETILPFFVLKFFVFFLVHSRLSVVCSVIVFFVFFSLSDLQF